MTNQKKQRSILLLSYNNNISEIKLSLPLPYAWPAGVQDKQYDYRRHEPCMLSNSESTSKESENIYLPFRNQNTMPVYQIFKKTCHPVVQ
jgi:hypothetical protein